jgi:hypothetical protein
VPKCAIAPEFLRKLRTLAGHKISVAVSNLTAASSLKNGALRDSSGERRLGQGCWARAWAMAAMVAVW